MCGCRSRCRISLRPVNQVEHPAWHLFPIRHPSSSSHALSLSVTLVVAHLLPYNPTIHSAISLPKNMKPNATLLTLIVAIVCSTVARGDTVLQQRQITIEEGNASLPMGDETVRFSQPSAPAAAAHSGHEGGPKSFNETVPDA